MVARLAADILAVVHFAFVLFVVFGGFLTWHRRWVLRIHLPAAAWGTLIEFMGWICPLTPLENALRHKAGEAGYAGGFIEQYLLPIVYPAGLTRGTQVTLGVLVVLVNVVAYLGTWRRRKDGGRA